jgi:hypothetical protein
MEAEWTPQMMETLGIDNASLPIIRRLSVWTTHRVGGVGKDATPDPRSR